MILISHRGNINGPEPKYENSPVRIDECINAGYDVEIDLRHLNGNLYLGHDTLQYKIDESWLLQRNKNLWVHCKDKDAFHYALKTRKLNCFWHDNDDYTMTSWGFVWAYPGKEPAGPQCIAVMPELHFPTPFIVKQTYYGVCSDVIEDIRNYINNK